MRSNSEFKELVYKKACEETARIKKKRTAVMRGVSTFCICLVIGGAVFYGSFSLNDDTRRAYECEIQENGGILYGINESAFFYSKSAPMAAADVCENFAVSDDGTETKTETTGNVSVKSFSFEKELENSLIDAFKDKSANSGGASIKISAATAVEIAKQKCTVDYDTTDVYYDYELCVWKIVFYTKGTAGGCQDVYLIDNGDLLIIAYGE